MKNCDLCGDPLPADAHHRRRFCDDECKRVYNLRKRSRGAGVGDHVECDRIGCDTVFVKKNSQNRFCNRICVELASGRMTGIVGKPMICECCGEVITRTGPNQIFCRDKCDPVEGLELFCVRCDTKKLYSEFYDYRHNEGGKLITACKSCIRADNSARARRNKHVCG